MRIASQISDSSVEFVDGLGKTQIPAADPYRRRLPNCGSAVRRGRPMRESHLRIPAQVVLNRFHRSAQLTKDTPTCVLHASQIGLR